MLKPSTPAIISGPRNSGGQASARTNSSQVACCGAKVLVSCWNPPTAIRAIEPYLPFPTFSGEWTISPTCARSEEHTSELQSQSNLVCRLLLEKKKQIKKHHK